MAGNVSGLHQFGPDTGPEALSLLDNNYGALTTALNTLASFTNNYLDSGAVNALIVTVAAPQVFSYSDGIVLSVKVAATNTNTTPTINVNGLGLKTIVNPDGSALAVGQLVAGGWSVLEYESTSGKFMLVGGSGFAVPKFSIGPPSAGNALTVAALPAAGGSNPGIVVTNTAGNLCGISLAANGGTPGTNDFLVFQNTNGDAFLDGRPGILGLQTAGTTRIAIANPGNVTVNAPSSGNTLTSTAVATAFAGRFNGTGAAGQSFGIQIVAGSNASDQALQVINQAVTANLFVVRGDGAIQGLGPVAATLVDMTPDTGTFTLTGTGFTAGVTATVTWTRVGKLVTAQIGSLSGTSNATTLTGTGVPAAIQPATLSTQTVGMGFITNNGVATGAAFVTITNGSGTWTFGLGGGTNTFTASGAKSIVGQTFSYLLN
jgi:hypothetical protein